MKKIHNEKIINTKSLFELQDVEGNKISYVLDYQDKENPEKEYKMVLIANVNMYNNLKNNQITNISWIVFIRWFHLIKKILN